MKQSPIPPQQGPYVLWHDSLMAAVTATVPGVKPADVTAMAADNADMHAKQDAIIPVDDASIAAHNGLNTSIGKSRKQVRAMIKNIKNDATYTEQFGETLHIEGAEDTTDMTQEQPHLTATAKPNGVVEISFNKKLAEGVHLKARFDSDPGYTYLGSETHSPYVDNRPLQTAGKPEARHYQAVFFMDKVEVGNPSDAVTAIAQP